MITRILGGTAIASALAAIVCFNLWQGVKEDLAEQIASCNTEHLQAALDGAMLSLDALKSAHADELAMMADLALVQQKERDAAARARDVAESVAARHQITIEQLELEAETDDIPDSRACLNAYIPRTAIKWLCVQAEDNSGAGGGSGASGGAACSDTGGFDTPDSISADFAAITFGGAVSRWGRDRRSLVEANAKLAAIERLQGKVIDELETD